MFIGSCTTNHLTLFPASCLNVSLFAHVQYLKSSAQLYSLYFLVYVKVTTFIYSICIVKADSRLVVYRFILFYFVLYICIYVAPWSWHLVPLYVHTCSGMTIKLNLNLNLISTQVVHMQKISELLYLLFFSQKNEQGSNPVHFDNTLSPSTQPFYSTLQF